MGALCRELLSEDLSRILPLRGSNKHLSPTTKLTDQIYTSLLEAGAIVVSPNSPLTAFDLEHADFPTVFLKDAVKYRLNLAFPEKTPDLIPVFFLRHIIHQRICLKRYWISITKSQFQSV